jgi:hypothetical protein
VNLEQSAETLRFVLMGVVTTAIEVALTTKPIKFQRQSVSSPVICHKRGESPFFQSRGAVMQLAREL